jgi:hypothetical protein
MPDTVKAAELTAAAELTKLALAHVTKEMGKPCSPSAFPLWTV